MSTVKTTSGYQQSNLRHLTAKPTQQKPERFSFQNTKLTNVLFRSLRLIAIRALDSQQKWLVNSIKRGAKK